MKGSRFIAGVVATAVAAALATIPVSPAGAQTVTFSSGFQVQNLSTTAADVSIAFYALDGATATATVAATIPASGQVTYSTLPTAVAAGFNGSAVISSNQRVAAIANIISPDFSLSLGGGSYVGVTEGSTSLNLPLLAKAAFNFNSFFNIQNVGQTATAVTVTYSGGGLTTAVSEGPVTLQPGAAHRFDQAANTSLPAGFNGSAIVSSTAADIAGVVTQVGPTTVLIYNGIPAGSTTPFFPLVNTNNRGTVTGIALQNAGDQASEVTVNYTPSGTEGTACAETKTIPAKGTAFFAIDAFRVDQAGENCANGALFVGSARVGTNSTGQPLVAIVNQLDQAGNKGASYSGFDPNDSSATVVLPLVQDRVFGFFTGTSIVNVGTVATTIECTYSGSNVTQTSGSIAPGGSFTTQQVNQIGNQYNGSGSCRATAANAKIVGIVNYINVSRPSDTFFVYEMANN